MDNRFLNSWRRTWESILVKFKAQTTFRKVLMVIAIFPITITTASLLLFILIWTGLLGPLPSRDELDSIENPLATEVFSADSVLLGRYFIQERSNTTFKNLPTHLVDAVIATEDVRFYKHHGIDSKSILRVMIKSILLQQESSGGGSTLTQQLAKNLFPRKDYYFLSMPVNKIREMIVASRLENIYDKQSLLTLYLNTVPFGDNTFGIEAAAQRFFSVHTSQLSITEAAVLVGMLKASHYYNPRVNPKHSLRRRNVVLAQMSKYGLLSQQQVDSLKVLPLKLSYNQITHHTGLAPYFREYIRMELIEWCKLHKKENGEEYNLYTDGLKIYTTIDSRLQKYAEDAVAKQMTILQKKFNRHWGKKDPWGQQKTLLKDAIRKSDRYKLLTAQGHSYDEVLKALQVETLMNVLTVDGEKEMMMSPLDSIRHYLKFLQAGVLAMDPKQGAVRVWVGGINHNYFQYDHVRESTKRQIGSTFKPIVYAAALEQGAKPCDFFSASKIVYNNLDGWAPENSEDNYDLKYSLTGGLTYSVNTVSVRVLERAGINNTIALARRMGIKSDLPQVPSIALGTPNISMMEMVKTYACFVNDGKVVEPFYITAIADHKNKVLQKFTKPTSTTQAMSAENAKLIVEMLKHTVNEGTAASLRSQYGISNDIAGKTGTTQANADGWFIAMTPKLVIGAWVGADDPRIRFRTTALGQGARTALPIVADFFSNVNADTKLSAISRARFPPISSSLEDKLSCELFKTDKTFLEKIFGKKEKKGKRKFGEKEKKKGFFKRLFGN